MDIASKRTAALELLAKTGMRRSIYEPPLLRLLWKLGFDVPPPHFSSFARNFVFEGVYFGVTWGVPWWLFTQFFLAGSIAIFWPACGAGLFFGFFMAAYYAYGARKHGITRWHAFVFD